MMYDLFQNFFGQDVENITAQLDTAVHILTLVKANSVVSLFWSDLYFREAHLTEQDYKLSFFAYFLGLWFYQYSVKMKPKLTTL